MKEHCDCCIWKTIRRRWTLVIPAVMLANGIIHDDCYLGLAGLGLGAVIYELQEIKKVIKNSCWY